MRIKIKNMELAIIKRESCGTGANVYNESETVAKFEIMDGAPVRGASLASEHANTRSARSTLLALARTACLISCTDTHHAVRGACLTYSP